MSHTKSQLKFRCRRGLKELDVMFVAYVDHCYDHQSEEANQLFVDLLEWQDSDLLDLMLRPETHPEMASNAYFKDLLQCIRSTLSADI